MKQEITVTAEQVAMRDEWELRLMRGGCDLHEALFMCMASGAPFTPYLIDRFEMAINAYLSGEVSDLAEPFGLMMSKREKNAEARKTWISHVRFHVDSFHGQGYSKQDPTSYESTAFHKAAALLGRSPSQIFDTYYGKK